MPVINKTPQGIIIPSRKSLNVSDLSNTMYPGVPPQAEMKDPTTDKAMKILNMRSQSFLLGHWPSTADMFMPGVIISPTQVQL